MNTKIYQLADDVFSCLSQDHLVFLDLRNNMYSCLNGKDTKLAMAKDGIDFDKDCIEFGNNKNNSAANRIFQDLINSDLIIEITDHGRRPCERPTLLATKDFPKNLDGIKAATHSIHFLNFFRASFSASWKLRWYSMQRTVHSVKNRKNQSLNTKNYSYETLFKLKSTFDHLRPFYGRRYLCLFDSLALLEFLAYYNIYPQWVFGVRAQPFNAHCWLQEGDYVLNDTHEYIRGFTPIMTV